MTVLLAFLLSLAPTGTALTRQAPAQESLAPPRQLTYANTSPVHFVGEEITPNRPELLGRAHSWTVEPALPGGLALDPMTGVLRGTPTETADVAAYVIRAGNAAGSTSVELRLAVREPQAVERVDNGFGQLLPHRSFRLDANGDPTNEVIELRSIAALVENVSAVNPIFSTATWPPNSVLPNGSTGNQFLHVRFVEPVAIDSVLDGFGLTENLQVLAVDAAAGLSFPVPGRAFVGGRTVPGPGGLPETWVVADRLDADLDGQRLEPVDVQGALPGLGFPGTSGGSFAGDLDLIDERSVVFVPDQDGDLTTAEGFPGGFQIVLVADGVRSSDGSIQRVRARAASTRGVDTSPPAVGFSQGLPDIAPPDGALDVPPGTPLRIVFSEPLQPFALGGVLAPGAPGAVQILASGSSGSSQSYTPSFLPRPASAFDLATWILEPVGTFVSEAPPCGFGGIEVTVNQAQLRDLSGNASSGMVHVDYRLASTPALVNVAVTPDTIYVGRTQGLSVIDLNGFGASTGDPTYDFSNPNPPFSSNYDNNPNLAFQGSLLSPPLAAPSCFFHGGANGVLSLATDASDGTLLVESPVVSSISDMALGAPLDLVLNNAAPFGCQQGGGNLCASAGLQLFQPVLGGPNTLAPYAGFGFPIQTSIGGGNPVSFAPHPNPPPLVLPATCGQPEILGQEPTSPSGGLVNLLVPGLNFLGDPALNLPPSNLLSKEQNAYFVGPGPPQANPASCATFTIRQQIGHFLYVADRAAGEVVVLNSNRMLVLARIEVPDATKFAMGTNLDFLAVTSQATDSVYIIDVDPRSSRFHEVVAVVSVGDAPSGIAWEPGNEDILVCNEGDSTVSILSTASFSIRKNLTALLNEPFEVVITPRQDAFGLFRNVYFAWILNRDGRLVLFESGPDGINGWGHDDIVGELPFAFQGPQALQPDPFRLRGGVTVLHSGKINGAGNVILAGGAVSGIGLNGPLGQLPLTGGAPPSLRGLSFQVLYSLGQDVLSGDPVDLAFDNQRNFGALRNHATPFGAGSPADMNGKSPVRRIGADLHNTSEPALLFLAIPDSQHLPGRIDVLDLTTGTLADVNPGFPGVQSIDAPGVAVLMDYFRQ